MESERDVLKQGTTEITNPNELPKMYIDGKDKTVMQEATMELKPLEGMMRKALMRRGVAADKMSYENVIVYFYNEFVVKPNEKKLAITYLSEHPLTGIKVSEFDSVNHADQVTAVGLVTTGVKNLATNIRNKAKLKKALALIAAGRKNELSQHDIYLVNQAQPALLAEAAKPLTTEEAAIASDTDAAVKKLEKKEENDLSVSEGKLKNYIIIAIVLIGVALAIWYFVK